MKDKLKLITTIKYEAWGHPMVGIFYSDAGYNFYFRNAVDKRLKEIMNDCFSDPEECLDNAIEVLTKLGMFSAGLTINEKGE